MDFGYVLGKAWKIIWKYKILWIFGILAGLGQATGSGGSNSGYRFSSQNNTVTYPIEQYFNQIDPTILTLLIVAAVIIALVLLVVVILLGTVGRVGLIRGTVKAEGGAERLTFGELWRESLPYFWRVFGLNLLVGLILFVAFIVLLVLGIILTVGTLGVFLICVIPLLCLLVPAMWVVSIIIEQANVALVVENLSITEGIKRGWQVVINNIGNMIVMGLILVVGVTWIGGAIIGLPVLPILAPAAIGIASGISDNIRNGLILSGALFLLYLPILVLLSGILRSYVSSAWTLTYLRLTSKPAPPTVDAVPTPVEGDTPPAPPI